MRKIINFKILILFNFVFAFVFMNERREVSTKFDIMVDFVFEIKKKIVII
jgi:hypothetical protein